MWRLCGSLFSFIYIWYATLVSGPYAERSLLFLSTLQTPLLDIPSSRRGAHLSPKSGAGDRVQEAKVLNAMKFPIGMLQQKRSKALLIRTRMFVNIESALQWSCQAGSTCGKQAASPSVPSVESKIAALPTCHEHRHRTWSHWSSARRRVSLYRFKRNTGCFHELRSFIVSLGACPKRNVR